MASPPTAPPALTLPSPCLVVLVGPAASGKSTWAAEWFPPTRWCRATRSRALVGEGEHDLTASKDAFALLDTVVQQRLRRRLTTVVDTLGLDAAPRARYRDLAARRPASRASPSPSTSRRPRCRARNRARGTTVPAAVAEPRSCSAWPAVRDAPRRARGSPRSSRPGPVRGGRPPALAAGPHAAQGERTADCASGCSSRASRGRAARPRSPAACATIAGRAEEAGFDSALGDGPLPADPAGWARPGRTCWRAGRRWRFLAAGDGAGPPGHAGHGHHVPQRRPPREDRRHPRRAVRRPGGVRPRAGLVRAGAHRLRLATSHPRAERYALLEDALAAPAAAVGPGHARRSTGRCSTVPEAICYPRPLQEHVPILVGGSGERRTLRLVAQHADACNLFGEAAAVRHKVEVLRRHCAEVGRDPAAIEVTHLSTVLVGGRPWPGSSRRSSGCDPADERRPLRRSGSTPAPSTSTSGASASSAQQGCRRPSSACPTSRSPTPSPASGG